MSWGIWLGGTNPEEGAIVQVGSGRAWLNIAVRGMCVRSVLESS